MLARAEKDPGGTAGQGKKFARWKNRPVHSLQRSGFVPLAVRRQPLHCVVLRIGMKHENCNQQITVRIPRELRAQLEAVAEQERRTPSNLMRLILESALAAREHQAAA